MLKKALGILLAILSFSTFAYAQSIPSQSPWWVQSGNITQLRLNSPVQITGPTPGGCVQLTSQNIATTTGLPCGSGSGTVTQINTTYPVQGGPITTTGTISLAFGTTTANTWSGLQTFTNTGTTSFSGGISGTYLNLTGTSASSTFANGIQLAGGCFRMPNGSCLVTSSGGTVTSITAGTGLNGGTITTSGTISQKSYLATSSAETAGQLSYWTSTAGTPATLGSVATTALSVTSPITFSGTLGAQVGGAAGSFACATCNTNGFPTSTNPLMATYFVATSSTATSTFAGNVAVTGNLRVDGNFFAPVQLVTSGNATINGALTVTGQTTLATSLTGYLKAASGVVSSQAVPIPVADGGTASTTLGGLLTGNGTGAVTSAVVSSPLTFSANTLACATCLTSSSNLTGTTGQVAYFSGTNNAVGTSTVFISTASKVGIGTTSPQTTLHVQNDTTEQLRLEKTSNATTTFINGRVINTNIFAAGYNINGASPGEVFTGSVDGRSYSLQTQSIDRLTITSPGNIGINTTGPLAKLHVLGSGTPVTSASSDATQDAVIEGPTVSFTGTNTSNLEIISNSTVAADAGGSIGFGAKYSGDSWIHIAGIKGAKDDATSGVGGYLAFGTRAVSTGNLAERMRITSTGNVGIGTTNPTYNLSVNGYVAAVASDYATNGGYLRIIKSSGSGTNAIIQAGDNVFADKLAINPDGGNVGIGTTTPQSLLTVAGDAHFQRASGSQLDIQTPSSDIRIVGTTVANAAQKIFINPGGGNIGIGNTTGAQALDVTGTIRQSNCTTAGTLSANGSGDIICTVSSQRFKDNITGLDLSTAELLKLNPVSFTYKPSMNMGSGTHEGFISEQVAAINPALATYDKDGKPYGVDTNAILALTVKALQEANARIDALEKEVKALKDK